MDRVRFAAVTHVSTSISLIACLLMAVTGYLTFTDKTQVGKTRQGDECESEADEPRATS
jgi:hypothetical protein